MTGVVEALRQVADLGGPVVLILIGASVVATATVIYKLWQSGAAGVGRHSALAAAVAAWDAGDRAGAQAALARSKSHLAPVIGMGFAAGAADDGRLRAEAETRLARLESGFHLLDSVAQLAPLLGLFGTVLGMIEAFRSLQEGGAQVDPSLLAGGIWVALLTTAAGRAVAMPAALVQELRAAGTGRVLVVTERVPR